MLALLAAITLTWTAPGDDANVGTAAVYDVRYSLDSSAVVGWTSATQATGVPAPRTSGTTETFQLNLSPGKYWFAVRTWDEAGNQSLISNIISKVTSDSNVFTTITFDDFEVGYGNFTDGGDNSIRYAGSYSHQGQRSIDLQDNTSTSLITTTTGRNVSGYATLEVDFWFKMVQLEEGEDFWLQYSPDGGTNWQTVASWTRTPGQHDNNTFYNKVVKLTKGPYNFSSNAKIRFRCDASSSGDDVYIDEVTWRGGMTGTVPEVALEEQVTAEKPAEVLPGVFALDQNYPNPFNPTTSLAFELPEESQVTLLVFNVLGQEVATLAEGRYPAGRHIVQWNARGKASGLYFYRLQAGAQVQTRSMMLLK